MKVMSEMNVTLSWQVQRRTRSVWRFADTGQATTKQATTEWAFPPALARDLAFAALSAHLMRVDHETDLADRRALVRWGLVPSESLIVTEAELESYLDARGYYLKPKVPLCEVLETAACEALPQCMQSDLRWLGPPGPAPRSQC